MKRKIAKKWLNCIWSCKEVGRPNIHVSVVDDGRIKISVFLNPNSRVVLHSSLIEDSQDCSPKRINQCLEATRR